VVENGSRSILDTRFIPEVAWDEVRDRGTQALEDLARLHFDGLCTMPVVRHGNAAAEITKFAASRGIGTIMIPAHGCERLRVPLLGAVTTRVLGSASCPVWTLPIQQPSDPRALTEIRSLLCAIDLGPESPALIREAESLGAQTGAKVRLVYAVAGEPNQIDRAEIGYERYIKDCARASVARLQDELGTAFNLCMEAGRPSRVIAAVARHHDADLVIIGRGRHGGSPGLRGEAYSIVHECPCPVLSS
jgi:nucleotide-binding universal stress UspA family protein